MEPSVYNSNQGHHYLPTETSYQNLILITNYTPK